MIYQARFNKSFMEAKEAEMEIPRKYFKSQNELELKCENLAKNK